MSDPPDERVLGACMTLGAVHGLIISLDLNEFGEDHAIAVTLAYIKVEAEVMAWLKALTGQGGTLPWSLETS